MGLVIIDNGHGVETKGKRSPDGLLMEWRWTREIARRVADGLIAKGIEAVLLVPEDADVPLRVRTRRANALCAGKKAILVSIHANAAGMGEWKQARGWSVHVAPNASKASKALATALTDEAQRVGLHVRKPAPGVGYWTQSLAICRDTACPAVLTENLFMDNRDDCAWMLTETGKDTIASLHAAAIAKYLKSNEL